MKVCRKCGHVVRTDDAFAKWRATTCTALVRRGRLDLFTICGGMFEEAARV